MRALVTAAATDVDATANDVLAVLREHGYSRYPVCRGDLSDVVGVVSAQGAAGGFVFTSGYYTEEAIQFAKPLNLTLVDGRQLHKWLQQGHAGLGAAPLRRPVAQVAPPSTPAVFPPAPVPTTAPATAPACPLCAKTMVLRTAKRGASAGNGFWGCSGYPACRGTRAAS